MITSNASKIAEELRQYQEEVKRKLTHMVKSYVSELAESAVGATPLGDSTKHLDWYQRRFKSTDLQPKEGLAKGGWTVVVNRSSVPFIQNYGVGSGSAALDNVKGGLSSFSLGDSITLGNAVPYISLLENGYSLQAPEGITSIVMKVYRPDLVRYFQQG